VKAHGVPPVPDVAGPGDVLHCLCDRRNHQGLENELIDGAPSLERSHRIGRRQRLGGIRNYYNRAA
jgi:hypothetical protein